MRHHQKISKAYVNQIAFDVVGCAIEVHRQMGPGLLEDIYEKCLLEELPSKELDAKSQVRIQLMYKGKVLDKYHVIDILVNDLAGVEIKAVEHLVPIYKAQLLTYLKLAGKPEGLLINFHVENITQSLVPLVTNEFALLPDI
jgi:GxxExxY protein